MDAPEFSSATLISPGESGCYLHLADSGLLRLKQDVVRVPNYESGGQEFESLRARHSFKKETGAGSSAG
jgi:hypothetical protein